MILYQAPKPEGSEELYKGLGHSFFIMLELARRETFLFKGRDFNFYWFEDMNCMKKLSGAEGLDQDAVVLYTREKDKKTGKLVVNEPLLNRVDVRDY